MDARTVRETVIKPRLLDIFGSVMANLLLVKATGAGMKGGSEQEKLGLMIEAICSDPRVIGMWGVARVTKQKQEWMARL